MLWSASKRHVNKAKIMENCLVFSKQAGYSPWPSSIVSINKSQTAAIVKYYGYDHFVGSVKLNEIVQVDDASMEAIGALVSFTMKTKSIKDFARYERGIREVQLAMKFNCKYFLSIILFTVI